MYQYEDIILKLLEEEGIQAKIANDEVRCCCPFHKEDNPSFSITLDTGKYINKLGALVVDFKGNSVGIGTGFNDIDRQYIWDNRDKLLGRVVELRYFEVTKDKNGIESLRFPSFVCIREEGKEVSYN